MSLRPAARRALRGNLRTFLASEERTVGTMIRLIRWLRSSFDGFDFFFGILPWMSAYAAFTSWLNDIVAALREEGGKESRRTTASTALFVATRAMADATEARESVALRGSVVEMRQLLKEAAKEAEERDKRAAARDRRLFRITVAMAVVAACTLLASMGAVVVAFVHA
jgi:hypothetical protein